ncbi:AaceriADR359Wp [[Ashbya] aceris (nom. inval.)]|nr:AaceriADR359Wp [[Ashbya] aceris (nom. inval.)]
MLRWLPTRICPRVCTRGLASNCAKFAQGPAFFVKPITPNDLFVSCTVFNERGAVTGVSTRYPKLSFLRDRGLYPRDLRKLDTSSIEVIPSIVVKPTCILVNLLHIKAVIEKNRVYVFDTASKEAAARLGVLMYDLESKLASHSSQPAQHYEHRALESILVNVMTCLETEFKHLSKQCGLVLNELEDQIDREKLRDLLIHSKDLTSFYQKSLLIRDMLDELLESDEDLAGMCLSPAPGAAEADASEVEMLLETYYKQCDEYVQQSGSLLQNIKSTEDVVNIILDANRNSLMLFELKVTIYTLGFTVATLIPAFYGMNLKNFIEESVWGFGGVLVVSVAAGLAVTASNFKALRSVARLTVMNSHSTYPGAKHISSARIHLDRDVPTLWMRMKTGFQTIWFGKSRPSRDGRQRDMIWKWLLDDKSK